jgi:multiple sugar transport system permease protein
MTTTAGAPRLPAARRASRRERWGAPLFLLPAIGLIVALGIFPALMSLGLSFVYWDFANPEAGVRWAGLDHWARMLSDTHLREVAVNTLLYVLVGVPLQYGLGLLLAVALNEEFRARNWLRVLTICCRRSVPRRCRG